MSSTAGTIDARVNEALGRTPTAGEARPAFTMVYRQHYATIATYIFRRVGDRGATEDVTSETFLAAMRAYPQYQERGLPVVCWLYRIASGEIARWARHRRTRERLARVLPFLAPRASGTAGDAAEQLRRALAALQSEQQEALVLHEVEGLSVEQVALVQGVAEGTVKSRLSRAREALRARLGASA
jgi:RNA polymerase sigma-70 factor (ECF subfamily)